jgi:glycosyltransferase involved in cell wall biosynthesis
MRILWVGTKPPLPATDGGRLLAALTLQALAEAGHELTLVAPLDPARDDAARAAEALRPWCDPVLVPAPPRPLLLAALLSAARGKPVSVLRHSLGAVRRRVGELLAARAFDVVHAEQPQALAQCEDAVHRGLPVVLRAQNVEADLWRAAAGGRHAAFAPAWLEARRMARFEGRAVRGTSATLALTARDADRLRALAGEPDKVHHVPAPFPARLPGAEAPLDGEPAVVLLGSGGWRPNQQGTAWFVRAVWPEVRAALPGAVLHLFGAVGRAPARPDVVRHPILADSRDAFAPGAVLVVPIPFGSGVRMKVLEAWARGVPVVCTPEAAVGLEAEDGRELLLASAPAGFAAALRRVGLDRTLAASLVSAGRELLAARHAPSAVASRIGRVYQACAGIGVGREGRGRP